MASGSVTFTELDTYRRFIGGLVGETESSSIIYASYATGPVTGEDYTGGLVGKVGGEVNKSYATGAVAGNNEIGGLVGYNNGAEIYDSYATGAVTGLNKVGGLVGNNNGHVVRTYSVGAVTGTGLDVGGLIGDNPGTCSDSFWATDTSTQGSSACVDAEAHDSTEMKILATYSAWGDFDYNWSLASSECSSYPSIPNPYLYPCLKKLEFLCFTGDTLITLADGKTKRIDQIQKGEKIKSFDDKTKISTSTVENVTTREVNKYLVITTSDNRTVKATPEHPFYTGTKFKPIKKFKIGESLYVNDKEKLTKVKITSITKAKEKVKVYNLHNDDNGPHTFFANGFAVHNK